MALYIATFVPETFREHKKHAKKSCSTFRNGEQDGFNRKCKVSTFF